ncbi:MAG: 4Fe-4S binding protein, partial [Coriobacteriaceae bacterium]|nr:4Fe-4S binding protein [Coriobacteriaceae bacterium]
MSKLDELEALAKEVSASTITILPKRCSYIRNWNSKCKACMNACPHDAISRSIGRFSIDPDLCTNCGACTAACPTSALLT